MKKTTLIIILVVLGLIAYKLLAPGKKQQPAGTGKPSGPARVSGLVLKGEIFAEKIAATGTVIANEEVELRPEASGKIIQMNLKEGSSVRKGELLVKINDADLVAQLEKQRSTLKLAEERNSRQQRLLDLKAISREEADISQNQVNAIRADISLIQAEVAKTEIRAPFDGKVGLRYVSPGSYVSPTSEVALIQDTDPVKIGFSIPEKYISRVHKGDRISFRVEGSDRSYTGEIYAIESKIDLQTRSVQIRATCPNREGLLYPGSFATVELELQKTENALLVPAETIMPDLKGQKVFVVRNGKAMEQKVETGTRTDARVLIREGLREGDTLITTGIMQLKPNTPVKVSVAAAN
jgi:membrane fusion protein, multidrug efflux system